MILQFTLQHFSMLVYYIRAKTNFQMEKVNFLKDTLQFTAEQKEFLLKYISEMSKGGKTLYRRTKYLSNLNQSSFRMATHDK